MSKNRFKTFWMVAVLLIFGACAAPTNWNNPCDKTGSNYSVTECAKKQQDQGSQCEWCGRAVNDLNGGPLPGAKITLSSSDPRVSGREDVIVDTDGSGCIDFSFDTSGIAYSATVTLAGYKDYETGIQTWGCHPGEKELRMSPSAPGVPTAPTGLAATPVSTTQNNLSWTDNSNNEIGFIIERKTGTAGTYDAIGNVSANVTSFQDTSGTCATTYYYRVKANNSEGDSSYSNEANVTTGTCSGVTIPTAPSSLIATVVSSSEIDLSWTDNSNNEDGFKIERKTGSGGTYSLISTTLADITFYSDTGLSAGTTYYYRIYAYNSAGNSSNSNEINATTQVAVGACSGDEYIDMGIYRIAKYEASHPDATVSSQGSDNSMACSQAGVLPWVDVDWNGASSACAAAGGRLCGVDEWGDTCDGVKGSGGSTYPYGKTYQGSTCNGSDAGKGGAAVPTGSMSGCVSGFGAYDLSGNVWEWTNEASGSNRVLRGGSCSDTYSGLGCAIKVAGNPSGSGYVFGFRCCQDK